MRNKHAFFFTFLFLASILLCLQTTILNHFPLVLAKPDLTIIMVAYLGVFQSPVRGLFLAFTLGCLMDTLSGSIPGLYGLLRIGSFILTRLAHRNFYLTSVFSHIVLTILLNLVDGVLLLLIFYILGSVENLWPFLLKFLPLQCLVTGAISPVIFPVLKKTDLLIESLKLAGISTNNKKT